MMRKGEREREGERCCIRERQKEDERERRLAWKVLHGNVFTRLSFICTIEIDDAYNCKLPNKKCDVIIMHVKYYCRLFSLLFSPF